MPASSERFGQMTPDNNVAVLCERCRPALRLPKGTDVLQNDCDPPELDTGFRLQDAWPDLPNLQSCISRTGCDFCHLLKVSLSLALSHKETTVVENPILLRIVWRAQRRPSSPDEGQSDNAGTMAAGLLDVMVFPMSEEEFTPLHLHFPITSRSPSLKAPPPLDRSYMTLSYSWGGQSQLLLTRESEQEFQTGISREKLSPIQRDTIALAQALSIPFVWIDALCIRQHDRRDWESEAPMMGKIYSGAYLTVCAASSSSGQEGYLAREFVTPITVPADPVSDPFGTTGGTYIFQPIMWVSNSHLFHRRTKFSLSKSQWVTRAWTLQEMMMSTRLLYFTTSGMHFNCGQRLRCSPYVHDSFGLETLYQLSNKSEIYLEWTRRVVMKHAGRKMTEPTDAFPSLSGLATLFASLLQDDYVAGLWKQSLAYGLVWSTHEPVHRSLASLLSSYNDPDPYISPSWSWVAHGGIRGLEVPDANRLTNACEAIDAICVPKTADKCGELKSASLTVRTRVCPFQRSCFPHLWVLRLRQQQRTEEHGGYRLNIEFDFQNAEYEDVSPDVWQGFVLVLITTYQWFDYEGAQPLSSGLVACLADDGVRYIRIGLFQELVCYEDDVPRLLEMFRQCDVKEIEII
ncbi:hypothetical protein PG990_002378 [Apiospora arundinis]